MVVSTSHDCRFKIWLSQCTSGTSRRAKMTNIWTCNATVFFVRAQLLILHFLRMAHFLLWAILTSVRCGIRSAITCWVSCHTHLYLANTKNTLFVAGKQGPYLLVITDRQCVIWDVIGCDVVWSVKCRCLAVGVDFENKGTDARFAIACESFAPAKKSALARGTVSVILFDASSPVPIYTWCLDRSATPRHIHFDTADGDVTRLVVMNEKREFSLFQMLITTPK